jgi:hypothetical protein
VLAGPVNTVILIVALVALILVRGRFQTSPDQTPQITSAETSAS